MKKMIQLLLVIATFTVAQSMKAQCTVNAGTNKSICCPGGTVTLGGAPTGSTSCTGISYVWSPSTGLSNVNVANPVASPSVTTVYTVCVVGYSAPTCTNVCCVACKTVTVTVSSICCRTSHGGTTGKHNETISVYPNPANNEITVEVENPIVNGELIMTDAMGKVVLTKNISSDKSQTLKVDVSLLPRGIYFVKVTGANTETYSNKVVLE